MRGELQNRLNLATLEKHTGMESNNPLVQPDEVVYQVLVVHDGILAVQVQVGYAAELLV